MDAEHLTTMLAERVMGWTTAPNRFLTRNRGWLPRWRFQPLTRIEHAFQLLEKAADEYTLAAKHGKFAAHVRAGDRTGVASGVRHATVVSMAVARAIGLDLPDSAEDGSEE